MSTAKILIEQSCNEQRTRATPIDFRSSPTRTTDKANSRATARGQSDTGLIARLKAGDEVALEKVFKVYSGKLYNVALRILGDASDAEEVIQDVFMTAFRKADSFQGNAQFSTWLYRLAVNAALGKIRRSKKHKGVEYEEFLPKFQNDGHHAVRPVVDWSDTLDEQYAKHEMQQLLGEALNQLKPLDKS
ncbi:MAG TPA: sigma-70 family RNA polymerase sigma factor, partial [Terriglobales bacterium]|nr:sigma-70 family RNA polymerase sigma factor [Terriglobales bacterium]